MIIPNGESPSQKREINGTFIWTIAFDFWYINIVINSSFYILLYAYPIHQSNKFMYLPVCLPACLLVWLSPVSLSIQPFLCLPSNLVFQVVSNRFGAQESSKASCYHPSLWDFGVANDVLLPEIPGWFRFVWIANRGLLWRPEYKETHKIIQSSHPLRQILSASASSHDHHSPVAQVSCWRASNWNLENNEMSFQETTALWGEQQHLIQVGG